MEFYSGAWSSLKFNAGRSGENILNSVSSRFLQKRDGNLVYVNNKGYKSVLIHVVKQKAMQLVEQQVNSLFPKYQRYLEGKLRETVLMQQKQNQIQLIRNQENQMKDWGRITADGNHIIVAKDKYGNLVRDALLLYYDAKETIHVDDVSYIDGKEVAESYETKTICFIDLVASVSMQSSKNLILMQVQGRDFTRKELISGGDLTFSISGKIVGNERGVYPENDAKKFIQLMQYGGVIKVNHFLFRQFNVNQIIIKDYNMGASEFKNEQPYNFTCVAVEPDEDVSIATDTIGVLNAEIAAGHMDAWYNLILNNKLSSIVADSITDKAASGITAGMDALVPNI